MNRNFAVFFTIIILLSWPNLTIGQSPAGASTITILKPYPLGITNAKTTHLIFPYAIKSVDRGSREVLAQKAPGVDNILLVKAGSINFPETNSSVITADGRFYSFLVVYARQPASFSYSFVNKAQPDEPIALLPIIKNVAHLEQLAKKIALRDRIIYGVKNTRYQVRLRLNGLYTREDVIFYQLEIQNHSSISYDTDLLRFYIRDKQQARRTAAQEVLLAPLYQSGEAASIPGHSRQILVFALPKFTIPDQKFLIIQLMEKNGGRQVALKVHNRTLLKARPIFE
jgi:conjugative transposon TraN protein